MPGEAQFWIKGQLVERSLLTPETRGSIPVIGKYYLLSVNFIENKKIKKWPGMAEFKYHFPSVDFLDAFTGNRRRRRQIPEMNS